MKNPAPQLPTLSPFTLSPQALQSVMNFKLGVNSWWEINKKLFKTVYKSEWGLPHKAETTEVSFDGNYAILEHQITLNPMHSGAHIQTVLSMIQWIDAPKDPHPLVRTIDKIAAGNGQFNDVIPIKNPDHSNALVVKRAVYEELTMLLQVLFAADDFGYKTANLHDYHLEDEANTTSPMPERFGSLTIMPSVQKTVKTVRLAVVNAIKTATHEVNGYGVIGIPNENQKSGTPQLEAVWLKEDDIKPLLSEIKAKFANVLTDDFIHSLPQTPDGSWIPVFINAIAPPPEGITTAVKVSLPKSKKEKPKKEIPPALLDGLTAEDLLELMKGEDYLTFNIAGPARIAPEVQTLFREKERAEPEPGKASATRYARVAELETLLTQSKIAVMEYYTFIRTFNDRRYPAKKWLESRLGYEINFNRANTVDITPDRLGEVPALVAGLHRDKPDRLCVVRLVMPYALPPREERLKLYEDYAANRKGKGKSGQPAKPLHRVKIKKVGSANGNYQLQHQTLYLADPTMLAFFPSGWLNEFSEFGTEGLLGTPFDPTLLEFCNTMPAEWWQKLRELLPPPTTTRTTLNIRQLLAENL